jgi:Short C-terminal domain
MSRRPKRDDSTRHLVVRVRCVDSQGVHRVGRESVGLFKSDPEKKAQKQAAKDALKQRTEMLTALCREQMGRLERMNIGMNPASVAQMLHEGERVTHVFGCQGEGLKTALVALTDSRLIFSYGMMGKNESVPYSAITQIDKGLTKVDIKGSGVDIELKTVGRPEELVNAINEKRRGPAASASPAAASDDPAAMLAQVAKLHQAGVLTDEEFAAKKADLLSRM